MANQAMLESPIEFRGETLPYCSIYIDSTVPSTIVDRIIDAYAENGEFRGVSHDTLPEEFDTLDHFFISYKISQKKGPGVKPSPFIL